MRSTLKILVLSLVVLMCRAGHALPIELSGSDEESKAIIESSLAYRRLQNLSTTDGALFWMRRLNKEAKTSLQAIGLYEATLETKIAPDNNKISVLLIPGEPTRVSNVYIQLPQEAFQDYSFPLKTGDRLDHQKYEAGKQQLHAWMLAHGYLNTKLITHRIEVKRAKRQAEIFLEWEAGPQYKFGPVEFVDNQLSANFLKRYIPFAQGEIFSESQLQKFSEQLRNSGYFSSVDIIPQLDAIEQLLVPLQVRLQPLNSRVYELGLSLGTDQGPGIEADVTNRRFNAKGHHWRIQSELTTQRFLLGTRYSMPSARHIDRVTRVDLTYVDELTDTSERQTIKSTLSKQRRSGKWQRMDSLSLLNEKFTIADVTEQSNLLIGSVDIFRTKAHDIINPSHGWRARATFSGASDILGSPLNFIRSDLEYKRIGSFNAKTRWLLRSRVGALWTDNFEKLPTSLRFFAGGDRSVRGFDFESLGPSDSENNVLGGQYIATLSLETDYMFRPNWRVATFVDIGNAFGRGDESLEHGAGVGLRWVSPIGPVRLDMASALSEPDNPWRLHFSVGPDL